MVKTLCSTLQTMDFSILIFLIFFTTVSHARIYSIENEDGSYTIGHTSDSRGETANSVFALLTKGAGYTLDGDYETPAPPAKEYSRQSSQGLLTPHMEILQLVETFLKFKGELASRFRDLINDNYELIRSVFQTMIEKIGTLHTFTLIGIRILRKILEFAVSLMVNWQVNLPGFSLGVNLGNNNQPNPMNLMNNYFN